MANNPYSEEQSKWLEDFKNRYRLVANGTCMETINACGRNLAETCEGEIGFRHAISKCHLKLIADPENKIRANKENESFGVWTELHDDLQRVSTTRFSAGKWSCQKHDQRFEGIDVEYIDLSKPENLFKAVYRVVLRHNHLMMARWCALVEGTRTEEGWERFKEVGFNVPVCDEIAEKAFTEFGNKAHKVMGEMRDLGKRLVNKEWNSFEYRAFLLESEPMVAGWGCLAMKFDSSQFGADDPRQEWEKYIDLAYMIVIPQKNGHAVITACRPETHFRVPDIVRVHEGVPILHDPNKPYKARGREKRKISRRIWELNELGMRESLYQTWSKKQQDKIQAWMKKRTTRQPMKLGKVPIYLPMFF